MTDPTILRVTYLELTTAPTPAGARIGAERIARERMSCPEYLELYKRVGEPLRWDQRIQMAERELAALLDDGSLNIYVLRDAQGQALGFCEFDRRGFPDIEIKNFGVVAEVQGLGLGSWLLKVALCEEWRSDPVRIWLHTDTWDHPAAMHVYQRAGFRVFAVRDEAAGPL